MNAVLRLIGVLCMIVGVGVEIVCFVEREPAHRAHAQPQRSTPAAPAPSASVAHVVAPFAPSLSTAFYAQNAFFHVTAALVAPATLRYSVDTRFTERVTIGFDRPVTTCRVDQAGRGRQLHVFSIAGIPGYSAVAYFNTAERIATMDASVLCTLAQPTSSARTDGNALAPLDPIIAHHRLEYAEHAALAGSPRALFPPRDPIMRRFPFHDESEDERLINADRERQGQARHKP